jgi:hypothetical protein
MEISIDPREAPQIMKEASKKAVLWAKGCYSKDLDFTPHSLAIVEEILQTRSLTIPKSWFGRLIMRKAEINDIGSICILVGAYIGEVLRKKFGGTWHVDSSFGGPAFALSIFDGKVYPIDKVSKRLYAGQGDSIWGFYQMMLYLKDHPDPK